MDDLLHDPTLDGATLAEHGERLRGLARVLVGESSADDLVQRTWLEALRSRTFGALDTRERGPYLRGIARRLAANERRRVARRLRRERAAARPDETGGPGIDPRVTTEQIELLEVVLHALKELPEPYRTTLRLRFLEQRSAAAIGEQTGATEGAVRVRVHRGLALLRERLDERHRGRRSQWLVPLTEFVGVDGRSIAGAAGLPLGASAWFAGGLVLLTIPALLWFVGDRPPALDSARGGVATAPRIDAERTRAVSRAPDPEERAVLPPSAEPVASPAPVPSIGAVLMPERTPVAGARVQLREADGTPLAPFDFDVRTEADGRARFPSATLAVPRYEIAVSYEGYGTVVGNVAPAIATSGEFEVELWPLLRYAGRVLDEAGAPIPGATVELRSRWTRAGRSRFVHGPELLRATTSDDGGFAFDGIVDGPLPPFLSFLHPAYRVRESIDLEQHGELRASLLTGLGELTLTRAPDTVRLTVVDPFGAALRGARVEPVRPAGRSASWTALTDAQGAIEIGLRSGEPLPILVAADGFAPRLVLLTDADARAPLRLSLAPPTRLEGAVVDGDGRPIPAAAVRLVGLPLGLVDGRVLPDVATAEAAQARLAGAPADADRAAVLGAVTLLERAPTELAWAELEPLSAVTTDAEGRFQLDGVPDGPLLLHVGADGFGARGRVPVGRNETPLIALDALRRIALTVGAEGVVGAPPETRYTAFYGRRRSDGTIETIGRFGTVVPPDGRGAVLVQESCELVRFDVHCLGYRTERIDWAPVDELVAAPTEIVLSPHRPGSVTILAPGGRPAAGAEAVAVRPGLAATLVGPRLVGPTPARADGDGVLELERSSVRTTLVVAHADGVTLVGDDWSTARDLTLSPWAALAVDAGPERAGWRVALDLRRAGRTAVGVDPEGIGGFAPPGLDLEGAATLDGRGRALVEFVPPMHLALTLVGPDGVAAAPARLLSPAPGERLAVRWEPF